MTIPDLDSFRLTSDSQRLMYLGALGVALADLVLIVVVNVAPAVALEVPRLFL